jgi:hypothetical protein
MPGDFLVFFMSLGHFDTRFRYETAMQVGYDNKIGACVGVWTRMMSKGSRVVIDEDQFILESEFKVAC